MNENVISKLDQELNFTTMVEVWFCDDDFFQKHKGKKGHFHRFSLSSKIVIFFLSKLQSSYLAKRARFFAFIGYPNLSDIPFRARN